jgi:hypothetical protein
MLLKNSTFWIFFIDPFFSFKNEIQLHKLITFFKSVLKIKTYRYYIAL